MVLHILMLVAGLLILPAGFYANYESKPPWNIIGGIGALVGLCLAILGTLLLCVPDFFSG